MRSTKDYTPAATKHAIIVLLFLILLSIFFIFKDQLYSIVSGICTCIAISFINIGKISLTDDSIVMRYGFIPGIKNKKEYKYNAITDIVEKKDKKDRLKSVRIDYTLPNGGASFMVVKRGYVSDLDAFVNDLHSRVK